MFPFASTALLLGLLAPTATYAHPLRHLAKRAIAGLPAFPPDGQVYFGAWLDNREGYSDSPAAINERMGRNVPVFQFGQRIPLEDYDYDAGEGWPALTYLVDFTQTNAGYFISVYPDDGIQGVTDGDLVALGHQLADASDQGRTTYLRFAPEMQGIWMAYGAQPTAYVELWRRMYTIIKDISPDTVIVWAPNYSVGYPWAQTLDSASPEDQTLLDTDGDGVLTYEDDAYAPYWPGPEYVDAAGLSVYFKGPNYLDVNENQAPGYIGSGLIGVNPYAPDVTTDFYNSYCEEYDLDCIITECGAAYHVDIPGGDSQVDMQQTFIDDVYGNTTFFETFPRIKMIMQFEEEKYETAASGSGQDLRDFRITNDTEVLDYFIEALETQSDRFAWAEEVPIEALEASSTRLPDRNPLLDGTEAMTTTVPVASEESEAVTWTYTTYDTPMGDMLSSLYASASETDPSGDQELGVSTSSDESSSAAQSTSIALSSLGMIVSAVVVAGW